MPPVPSDAHFEGEAIAPGGSVGVTYRSFLRQSLPGGTYRFR